MQTVAIIGVGLIGGSFGMAVKSRGIAQRVIGIGRNPERLQRAVELGAIDAWTTDLVEGVSEADLVYIATPVGTILDFVRDIAPHIPSGCIVTDAGSTKAEICKGADELVPRFVGGHPMAGSEEAGVEAAHPDLFVGPAYVLTPTEKTDPAARATVHRIAEAVGSRVIVMDPTAHDACTAVISHLPHVIAAALVNLAESRSHENPEVLELVAGSFRDATRVAGSSPVLWRDICSTNSESIRQSASDFCAQLEEGLHAILSGDADAIEEWFAAAKTRREQIYRHKES
ncbi:MAG: prephenate dehydrogenase [Armatimonadota bacterium]